jgi:hypothetical protein
MSLPSYRLHFTLYLITRLSEWTDTACTQIGEQLSGMKQWLLRLQVDHVLRLVM